MLDDANLANGSLSVNLAEALQGWQVPPRFRYIRTMVKVSEISGGRGIPTIPVFDRTVVGLQEAEQTSVGTVSYRMTANLDTVARLHVVQGDTDTFEPLATSRL